MERIIPYLTYIILIILMIYVTMTGSGKVLRPNMVRRRVDKESRNLVHRLSSTSAMLASLPHMQPTTCRHLTHHPVVHHSCTANAGWTGWRREDEKTRRQKRGTPELLVIIMGFVSDFGIESTLRRRAERMADSGIIPQGSDHRYMRYVTLIQ